MNKVDPDPLSQLNIGTTESERNVDLESQDNKKIGLGKMSSPLQKSMLDKMKTGMKLKFEKKSKELARLQQRVEGLQDPQKTALMAGIQTRLAAAVNMDSLEDKITASDSIRVETNIMMQKLEVAMLQRY